MMTEIEKEKKLVNSFQINFDTQCLPIVLLTLYDVCSVHWGISVHRGRFCTLRGYQYEYIGRYHGYIGVFNKNKKSFMNLLPT